MQLHLDDRAVPEVRGSKLAGLARWLFSLGLGLLLVAAAFGIAARFGLGPLQPRSPAPPPSADDDSSDWDLRSTRFYARHKIDIHQEPSGDSRVLGSLQPGDNVPVIHNVGTWLLVEAREVSGWIDTSKFRVRAPGRPQPGTSGPPRPEEAPIPSGPISVAGLPPSPSSEPLRPDTAPSGTGTGEPPPGLRLAPTPSNAELVARAVEDRREESPSVAWARERLSRRGLQLLESEHFRLWSDLTDSSRLGLLLGLAEQSRRRFRDLFEPHFELAELAGRSEIFLFRTRAEYLSFFRRFSDSEATSPSGHYSMDLRTIALSEQSVPGNSLAGTLVHEMVHLLLDQSLYGSTTRLPLSWIGEGLACVLAYTTGSEEGRIALVQSRSDRFGVGAAARMRVQQMQRELKDGQALPLRALLSAPNSEFVGAQAIRYYDSAWLLCHFLLYAENGRHRALLVEAIATDRGGRPLDAVEQEILALESSWRQYVLRLPAR